MARPTKITNRKLIGEVIDLIAGGVYPSTAARACGLSASTYGNWIARGREWEGKALSGVPKSERPYVEFLDEATRAEAIGLAWHTLNVTRVAGGGEGDGRLSLEFLARRQPAQYAKRVEVDLDPGDREPAPLDAPTVAEAREAFLAAHVPEGIDPASILPEVGE